jgi:hypothetical protein
MNGEFEVYVWKDTETRGSAESSHSVQNMSLNINISKEGGKRATI